MKILVSISTKEIGCGKRNIGRPPNHPVDRPPSSNYNAIGIIQQNVKGCPLSRLCSGEIHQDSVIS
jgi:hypothetical protein